MEDEDLGPPEKEFGPQASLPRRRILAAALIVGVGGFFWLAMTMSGNERVGASMLNSGASELNEPSIALFMLGAAGMVALVLVLPWLARRGLD